MKPRILLFVSALYLRLLITLQLAALVSAAAAANLRNVENAHPERWARGLRAAPKLILVLRVALHPHKNDDQLGIEVAAVADPASTFYGQYLGSTKELQKHFVPSEMSLQSFLQVMQDAKVLQVTPVNVIKDFWSVTLAAATAERLFNTTMFHYTHTKHTELSVVRPEETYSIPRALQGIVAYVDGLESFPTEMQIRFIQTGDKDKIDPLTAKQRPFADELRGRSKGATPAVIREQYDIPDIITMNHSRNHFDERSSMGQVDRNRLVIGTFLHESYNKRDLSQFLRTIDGQHQVTNMPNVTGPCISAHNPTGEASLDIQVTSALTGHGTGNISGIEMMCYAQLRDSTRAYAADNQEPFLTFLQDVNAMQPPPTVVSISYADDECSVPIAYAEAVNRELMKSALLGITVLVSAGDAGVRGSHFAEDFCRVPACSRFLSMFPASSPYVTAVGATTIAFDSDRDDNGKWKETVTSTSAGALITSGGGFSDLYDMPDYQRKAVTSYLAFSNKTGVLPFFRRTGRGLPDVAAVGHDFPVVVNGEVSATDGTSVSAPVLASMVVLLNRALPELSTLGFLNPLLYRLYDECPHVFADITQGNISCGSKEMQCCRKGHTATTGWDAASGLGTLRFSALLNDLPDCLARMRISEEFLAAEKPPTIVFGEEDPATRWTLVQQRTAEILGGIGLIAAVSLIGVLIALRERAFLGSSNYLTRYGSCEVHDTARESLLSRK